MNRTCCLPHSDSLSAHSRCEHFVKYADAIFFGPTQEKEQKKTHVNIKIIGVINIMNSALITDCAKH